MTEKLLPCPFCGGDAAVCDIKEPSVNGWVGCQRCRCFIDWVKDGKSLAIAAWNRRAQPENAPLTVEELRQMKESREPVWLDRSKQWAFIASIADAPYTQAWYFTTNGMANTVLYHREIFYRRKPERSEG